MIRLGACADENVVGSSDERISVVTNFLAVLRAVAVGVGIFRIRAPECLLPVSKTVAVGILCGILPRPPPREMMLFSAPPRF